MHITQSTLDITEVIFCTEFVNIIYVFTSLTGNHLMVLHILSHAYDRSKIL